MFPKLIIGKLHLYNLKQYSKQLTNRDSYAYCKYLKSKTVIRDKTHGFYSIMTIYWPIVLLLLIFSNGKNKIDSPYLSDMILSNFEGEGKNQQTTCFYQYTSDAFFLLNFQVSQHICHKNHHRSKGFYKWIQFCH